MHQLFVSSIRRLAHTGCRPVVALLATLVAIWSFSGQKSTAQTIVDSSSGPAMAMNDWCTSTIMPLAAIPAGGAAAMAQRATLMAQFAGIPGGQVVVGAAAPGTITVDDYFATVRGESGGAHISARYNDGVAGPSWNIPPPGSERWVHEINTNVPLGGAGSPYIDPRPGDDPGPNPQLPYYWTDAEAIGTFTNGANADGAYDLLFRDSPSRACDQVVTWRGDLILSTENRFTYPQGDPAHVLTLHGGFSWGFTLTPKVLKRIIIDLHDILIPLDPGVFTFTEGIGQTQAFETTDFLTLTDVAGTVTAGDVLAEQVTAHIPEPMGLLNNYMFDVVNEETGQTTSVFINQLDEFATNVGSTSEVISELILDLPIVSAPGVQNLSMTFNLADDLLVIVDENQVPQFDPTNPTQRIGPQNYILYANSLTEFDPFFLNFNLLAQRQMHLLVTGPGDMNGDGFVDGFDVDPFVVFLTQGLEAFQELFPGAPNPQVTGDFTGEGDVDGFDVGPFVDMLTGNSVPPEQLKALAGLGVPEPSTCCLLLMAVATLLTVVRRR